MLPIILFLFFLSTVTSDCNTPIIIGSIPIGGLSSTFIAQSGGEIQGGIHINNNSLTIEHNRRIYIAGSCVNTFGPDIFKGLPLLDQTLSFTADLSQVGCGCNAAFYLVAMPAYGPNNQPDPTKCGDYYCDANNVCGLYCVEMDIFEANNRAIQVTPHKCDAPQGHYYPSCDRGGCAINTYHLNPNNFGPGSNFIVNSQKPFRVSMSFMTSNNVLTSIYTVVSQEGKQFSFTHNDGHCGGGYLASMTDAFKQGMVGTFSYWGSTGSIMSWLDVPPCDINEACNQATTVTFSDFRIGNSTLVIE